MVGRTSLRGVGLLAVVALAPNSACADDRPPLAAFAARNTLDGWTILQGADQTPVVLVKVQISGTFSTDRLGLAGLSLHAQVLHVAGESLSKRIRDIQIADAIDALPITRLFEAWAEKKFGNEDRSVAVKLGLMDLNTDLDSISATGLFLNSSHGVGAELARSGVNGPSVYPVSAFGVRINVAPSKKWAVRYALLDGVAGDPARPRAFVVARLAQKDGTLSIGELDYRPNDTTHVAIGAWRYSEPAPTLDATGRARSQGAYGEIEGEFWKGVNGWLRVGFARGSVQQVRAYVGTGIMFKGLVAGRPADGFGIAVARAWNSDAARVATHVARAETSIETTYQIKVSSLISIQPDFQYIFDPSLSSGTPNVIALGVRVIMSLGGPKPAPATDPSTPTVAPPSPGPPSETSPTKAPESNSTVGIPST
ncbi:MAG: carbohydrate porin [Candidatus Sphingomonas colombiensis]|nr:carbohydrate porin [Sphingomonas sp.]WEK43382.1 MAG: carbohydrate porin [Sphingomonas sp.]